MLLTCVFHTVHAEEFTAKVIVVMDGDTVMVLRGSQKVKVRLANIDAPEKAQEGGMAARQSLSDMVLRREVKISSITVDEYGRIVGTLVADGKNVNEEQVRRGMAWEYSNFHRNKSYIALQNEAQQARRGLWTQPNPMPPWQWRKLHPTDLPGAPASPGVPASPAVPVAGDFTCGSKRHCSQMISCAEAQFYFTHCGVRSLDGNHDGVPCENLCEAKRKPEIVPSSR